MLPFSVCVLKGLKPGGSRASLNCRESVVDLL